MAKAKFERYRHTARPLFLPHRQKRYVAVRPFRWKGEVLQPGDAVPKWPVHHLRHLHAQSLIGPEDHDWSKQRMASWARRIAQGEERALAKAERQAAALEVRAAQADQDSEEAAEIAEEARSMLGRISDRISDAIGGQPDGGSAGDSDPA